MKKKIKLFSRIFLVNKKYKKKQYYHYMSVPDVAIMISIINGKFLLVSQKREAINKNTIEFPSGWVDKGEATLESAKRELFEETGYKSIDKPKKIAEFYEEPGRLDSKAICFFSGKLIKINKPEKNIKINLLSEKEVFKYIKNKKFNNGTHIAAFLLYINKLK